MIDVVSSGGEIPEHGIDAIMLRGAATKAVIIIGSVIGKQQYASFLFLCCRINLRVFLKK